MMQFYFFFNFHHDSADDPNQKKQVTTLFHNNAVEWFEVRGVKLKHQSNRLGWPDQQVEVVSVSTYFLPSLPSI
jgi:hypothetical protein